MRSLNVREMTVVMREHATACPRVSVMVREGQLTRIKMVSRQEGEEEDEEEEEKSRLVSVQGERHPRYAWVKW